MLRQRRDGRRTLITRMYGDFEKLKTALTITPVLCFPNYIFE